MSEIDPRIISKGIGVGGNIFSSLINAVVSVYQTERNISVNRELEELRQQNQERKDRIAFERQKELQQELAKYNRQTQIQIAAEQRKTALESIEANKLFENWPLRMIPSQILTSHQGNDILPLRIIPVPPSIDFDKFADKEGEFPRIEKYLAEGLRQFLHQNYSLNNGLCPVELLDGAWDSNRYHGGSSIRALFSMLRSEPILILESEIDGDYLNLKMGFWGLDQENYSYSPLISRLPFREMIYQSARNRAKIWKQTRDKILELGQDPKSINELDSYNLEIIEQEEALEAAGIDITNLPRRYRVNDEDFEAFGDFLVTCNCLIAGWVADSYHLIRENVTPKLPQLLGELSLDESGIDIPQDLMQSILLGYQNVYQSLEKERLEIMAELLLEFADTLKALPDKSWGKLEVEKSLKLRLELQGIEFDSLTDIKTGIQLLLNTSEYWQNIKDNYLYAEKVVECLTDIDDKSLLIELQGILSSAKKKLSIYLFPYQTFKFQTVTVDIYGKIIKKENKEAQYLRENLGNGVTMDLVYIPGGKFLMGSPESEKGHKDSESPQHWVTLQPFLMGKYPVTQAQWEAVMGNNPSYFKGENCPVECVSWNDCVNFCKKLSQIIQKECTIPTEAQWEYACRAGTTTPFYFGETITTDLANYDGNDTYGKEAKGVYRKETTKVGEFPPNGFGLYDLHGNVLEWCADNWHKDYRDAPVDGNAWLNTNKNNSQYLLRSGSWNDYPLICRSAYRNNYYSRNINYYVNYLTGFRVTCGFRKS